MKESKAKAFMFYCIGLLAVCVAVQVTIPATAQSPEPTTIAAAFRDGSQSINVVVMSNGDVYADSAVGEPRPWYFNSNVFGNQGPISNTDGSLGDVKRSFR